MKILVIEDDVHLGDLLRRGLQGRGHVVDVETRGDTGENTAIGGVYDVVVLDGRLPGRDGFDVVRAMRRAPKTTPVLLLTARDTAEEAIAGLDAGADDYLRKPFEFGELEARLRALSRREAAVPIQALEVGDVRLDLRTRRVYRNAREIRLTARELAYLEFFMRNAGTLVTKPMIEDALWTADADTTSNLIEVYVRRLRRKLSEDGESPLIRTVRGGGYRFGPAS
ncbi:MAG: heavy metal response regulator transcription factor [Candidatus Elarobacter sp.]